MQNVKKYIKKDMATSDDVIYFISVLEERRCSESVMTYYVPHMCTSISTEYVLRATYLAKICISIISENKNNGPQLLCACLINGLMNTIVRCRISLSNSIGTTFVVSFRKVFSTL